MRRSGLLFVGSFVAAFVVACGGSAATPAPGASTPAPAASQAAAETQAVVASEAPATSAGALPAGLSCAGMPTFNPGNPSQSFAPDTDLMSRFPTQIDGQPVTDVTSQPWLQWVCYWGGDAGLAAATEGMPANVNLVNLSIGSATATVDGESITFNAYRIGGGDASVLVQSIAEAASQSDNTGTLSQASVGGKSIYEWTSSTDQTVSYIYPAGDTLFVLTDATDSQAGKILAALP